MPKNLMRTRYGQGVSIPTTDGAEIEALAGGNPSFAAWDPFGLLRPWNELPALMDSAPPSTPPSTGTGVVTFLMG
jgi:hypothetical protein